MKRPVLCCFDIDGTIAVKRDGYEETDRFILSLKPHANTVRIVLAALTAPNVEVMFCTGRSKAVYGATWRWLNRHLRVASHDKRVSLVCRPPETPIESIPQYKLSELVHAIRRQPERLAELRCYDDSTENLRLMETLRPMVTTLRLYRVDNGVATAWSL